jgi:predicted O-methyltransferase YrrM
VPVLPGAGAALAALAAAAGAKAVVEIGTGAGVGSIYLLRGMRPDGVLTTIDVEVENQR